MWERAQDFHAFFGSATYPAPPHVPTPTSLKAPLPGHGWVNHCSSLVTKSVSSTHSLLRWGGGAEIFNPLISKLVPILRVSRSPQPRDISLVYKKTSITLEILGVVMTCVTRNGGRDQACVSDYSQSPTYKWGLFRACLCKSGIFVRPTKWA